MNTGINHERQFVLSFLLSGVLALCAAMCWAAPANTAPEFSGSSQQGTLQPGQRLEIPPMAKVVDPYAIDKKALLEANRKELHGDVERLFTLAQDLKGQSDKTDSTQTLSVDFVQNAKEIEKLSKKIQKLARN
ncbi:MAG: hypothetical protein ACRD37_12280 [Candidatus Acidiferrales bacterium]